MSLIHATVQPYTCLMEGLCHIKTKLASPHMRVWSKQSTGHYQWDKEEREAWLNASSSQSTN